MNKKFFVIDGKDVETNKYPFFARISTNKKSNLKLTRKYSGAGGALIHSKWVITAAHVIRELKKRKNDLPWLTFQIYELQGKSCEKVTKDESISVQAEKIIFFESKHYVDLALVKLKKPIDKVKVIPLINPNEEIKNNQATLIGFGKLDNDFLPYKLQECKLNFYMKWPNNIKTKGIEHLFNEKFYLLAGKTDWLKKSSAPGDSGGPLFIEKKPDDYQLIGIVSGGFNSNIDGKKLSFSTFVSIAKTYDWIIKTIKEN